MDVLRELQINKLPDETTFDFLDRLCEDSHAEVRLYACEALQEFPCSKTEKRFLQLLHDPDELVQCEACEALSSSKSEQVLNNLITIARENNGMLRGYAVISLTDIQKNIDTISEKVIAFLLELLQEETDNWVRIAIYRSLIVLGVDGYASAFLLHRKDMDYHNRCLMLNFLKEILDEGLWQRTENLHTILLEMYTNEDTIAVKRTLQELLEDWKTENSFPS